MSLTDPTDDWKVGTLPSGREYFFRANPEDPDDPEVRLTTDLDEEPSEASAALSAEWRVGTLPSGRRYLWRETDDPDDPEVKMYSESTLDSGQPFWYDDDGEVLLSNPFAGAAAEQPAREQP